MQAQMRQCTAFEEQAHSAVVELEVRVRFRVTKLRYVVLQPVYPIIRPPGWSLRA